MEKATKKYFCIFALPTMLAFTIGFIVPFLYGIFLSFCKFTTVSNWKWVGFKNYSRIFVVNGSVDTSFIHSIWYTALFTLSYVWLMIFNAILQNYSKTIISSEWSAFWGLIIVVCWQQIGYMMIIYIAGIQNIPGELIEAAKIDGASSWQLIRHVTLPMLMPTITICTFLTLTNGFKLFDQNLALTGGNPGKLSQLLALNIYDTMYGTTGWQGVGQAKAVIFFILVALIALVQNKITTSKEVQG